MDQKHEKQPEISSQNKATLEQELAEAKKAAAQANRTKSEFLSAMGREIRTPMNAIIGLTDITLQSELTDEQREDLETVKTAAESLLTIINDILDLSKIEAGQIGLESVDFDLHENLNNTVMTFMKPAEQKGIKLDLAIGEAVPRYLIGDPCRLRQVMINLLENALRFTSSGSVHVAVTSSPGSAVTFAVTDTGMGIPKETQDTIFDSFTQTDYSSALMFGGTGLGLSICKQIVRLMGGSIWVESVPGTGSTFSFTVRLPAGDKEKAEERKKIRLANEAPGTKPKAARILLAEDNELNARVAIKFLSGRHHIVTHAVNGLEAREELLKGEFDLVLTDLEMPDMNGLDLCRAIRRGEGGEENRSIPVIAMTAHATAEVQESCIKAGMNDYITKPVDFYELNITIGRILNDNDSGFAMEKETEERTGHVSLNRKSALRRMGNDEKLLYELYTIFLDELPERLALLEGAFEKCDFYSIGRLAHSLKGTAATIGAEMCSNFSLQLEIAAKGNDAKGVKYFYTKVMQELKAIHTLLERMGITGN